MAPPAGRLDVAALVRDPPITTLAAVGVVKVRVGVGSGAGYAKSLPAPVVRLVPPRVVTVTSTAPVPGGAVA